MNLTFYLYLFDDPLSTVDVKVGQHILEKCLKNLLGQKTRVIASHQEQFMEEADNIIVLYNGRVLGEGSLNGLKERGILNETIDPLYTMKVSSRTSQITTLMNVIMRTTVHRTNLSHLRSKTRQRVYRYRKRSHDRSSVIQALLGLLQKRVEFTGDNFIIPTCSHFSR